MEEKRAAQEKKVLEDERERRFQKAHPECLVMPSLRKLLIFGHWVISDEVLEIMLGRLFRNLESVNYYKFEGFKNETWVWITKAMPYLKNGQILWSWVMAARIISSSNSHTNFETAYRASRGHGHSKECNVWRDRESESCF